MTKKELREMLKADSVRFANAGGVVKVCKEGKAKGLPKEYTCKGASIWTLGRKKVNINPAY